jgi:hypothetical protein
VRWIETYSSSRSRHRQWAVSAGAQTRPSEHTWQAPPANVTTDRVRSIVVRRAQPAGCELADKAQPLEPDGASFRHASQCEFGVGCKPKGPRKRNRNVPVHIIVCMRNCAMKTQCTPARSSGHAWAAVQSAGMRVDARRWRKGWMEALDDEAKDHRFAFYMCTIHSPVGPKFNESLRQRSPGALFEAWNPFLRHLVAALRALPDHACTVYRLPWHTRRPTESEQLHQVHEPSERPLHGKGCRVIKLQQIPDDTLCSTRQSAQSFSTEQPLCRASFAKRMSMIAGTA